MIPRVKNNPGTNKNNASVENQGLVKANTIEPEQLLTNQNPLVENFRNSDKPILLLFAQTNNDRTFSNASAIKVSKDQEKSLAVIQQFIIKQSMADSYFFDVELNDTVKITEFTQRLNLVAEKIKELNLNFETVFEHFPGYFSKITYCLTNYLFGSNADNIKLLLATEFYQYIARHPKTAALRIYEAQIILTKPEITSFYNLAFDFISMHFEQTKEDSDLKLLLPQDSKDGVDYYNLAKVVGPRQKPLPIWILQNVSQLVKLCILSYKDNQHEPCLDILHAHFTNIPEGTRKFFYEFRIQFILEIDEHLSKLTPGDLTSAEKVKSLKKTLDLFSHAFGISKDDIFSFCTEATKYVYGFLNNRLGQETTSPSLTVWKNDNNNNSNDNNRSSYRRTLTNSNGISLFTDKAAFFKYAMENHKESNYFETVLINWFSLLSSNTLNINDKVFLSYSEIYDSAQFFNYFLSTVTQLNSEPTLSIVKSLNLFMIDVEYNESVKRLFYQAGVHVTLARMLAKEMERKNPLVELAFDDSNKEYFPNYVLLANTVNAINNIHLPAKTSSDLDKINSIIPCLKDILPILKDEFSANDLIQYYPITWVWKSVFEILKGIYKKPPVPWVIKKIEQLMIREYNKSTRVYGIDITVYDSNRCLVPPETVLEAVGAPDSSLHILISDKDSKRLLENKIPRVHFKCIASSIEKGFMDYFTGEVDGTYPLNIVNQIHYIDNALLPHYTFKSLFSMFRGEYYNLSYGLIKFLIVSDMQPDNIPHIKYVEDAVTHLLPESNPHNPAVIAFKEMLTWNVFCYIASPITWGKTLAMTNRTNSDCYDAIKYCDKKLHLNEITRLIMMLMQIIKFRIQSYGAAGPVYDKRIFREYLIPGIEAAINSGTIPAEVRELKTLFIMSIDEHLSRIKINYGETERVKSLNKTLDLFHQLFDIKSTDFDLFSKATKDVYKNLNHPFYQAKDSSSNTSAMVSTAGRACSNGVGF
jgi:hypothetical protein